MMLDLRRLRLLRELNERGTIAAVADALQFTPSAISQQLAILEREAGVPLLERAGRGVRLTDPALELVESEPEEALPALALGDVDLVLGDEWHHQPRRLPEGLERLDLLSDRVLLVLPARHAVARKHRRSAPLAELASEAWTSGHPTMGWEEVTQRVCRQYGGFDPDIRHRTNDANISLSLVANGLAVAMVPELALPERHPGITLREMQSAPVTRAIFAATRATDAARPSIQALVSAVQDAAEIAKGATMPGHRH